MQQKKTVISDITANSSPDCSTVNNDQDTPAQSELDHSTSEMPIQLPKSSRPITNDNDEVIDWFYFSLTSFTFYVLYL